MTASDQLWKSLLSICEYTLPQPLSTIEIGTGGNVSENV